MNAPSFLPVILSVLMLLLAVYAAWRLLVARVLERASDMETDALYLAAGLAAAGMVSSWAETLPRAVWTVVFALGTAYFAARLVRAWDDRAARSRFAVHIGLCAVLLYMLAAGVAPSTIQGSTAGQYTMAGMPGMTRDSTITFPSLGLVCVAVLAFYAVSVVGRLSPQTAVVGHGTADASGDGARTTRSGNGSRTDKAGRSGGATAAAAKAPAPRPAPKSKMAAASSTRPAERAVELLAPRSVECCRIALALVLAYAILSKLV